MTTTLFTTAESIIGQIDAFDADCKATSYTDTERVWQLFNHFRKVLAEGLQPDTAQFYTAFLLDPGAARMTRVSISKEPSAGLADLRRHIGARFLDRVWIDDTHMAYFNDEGMCEALTGMFKVPGNASTVPGRAVIVADDGTGEGTDTTPTLSMAELAARLTVFRAVAAPELVNLTPVTPGELGGAVVSAVRVGSFRVGIERVTLDLEDKA
jgi:hypothetical protein